MPNRKVVPIITTAATQARVASATGALVDTLRDLVIESAAHLRPIGRAYDVEAVQKGAAMSIDRLIQALFLLWLHPATPPGWPASCTQRIAATMSAGVATEIPCLREAFRRETAAQAEADVAQMEAMFHESQPDPIVFARTRDTIAAHVAHALAGIAALEGHIQRKRPSATRAVSRPQRLVASSTR